MAEAATKLPVTTEKPGAAAPSEAWAPFESLRKEIDRLFDTFHPFRSRLPSTRSALDFDLPRPGRVVLTVHDLKGARVATLVDADLPAGGQSRTWRGLDDGGAPVPSGVYFVRLSVGEEVRTVKVIMAR